jgi:hypothetical protein
MDRHVSLSRRAFLRLLAMTAAAALVVSCAPSNPDPDVDMPTFSTDQVADTRSATDPSAPSRL